MERRWSKVIISPFPQPSETDIQVAANLCLKSRHHPHLLRPLSTSKNLISILSPNNVSKSHSISVSKSKSTYTSPTTRGTLTSTLTRGLTVRDSITIILLIRLVIKIYDRVSARVFEERDLYITTTSNILGSAWVVVVLLTGS